MIELLRDYQPVLTLSSYVFFVYAAVFGHAGEVQSCKHDDTTFRCVKYLKNYDGDTITVKINGVHHLIGNKMSVRIKGVDTPEISTKNKCEKDAARTAKKLVQNILKRAKNIELREVEKDKYFRILSDVYADGKSIATILKKNGLAYEYHGGTKRKVDWCNFKSDRLPANED